MSFFSNCNASTADRSSRRPRRLGTERLEDRQMMAGDVTVDILLDPVRGQYDLSIVGDEEVNGIEVRRIGGDIEVRGVNVGASPTTINGSALPIRFQLQNEGIQRALDDIFIDMKDGDDQLQMINVDLEDRSGLPSLPYRTYGSNTVSVVGANGLQQVNVQNMRISGSLIINVSEGRVVANTIDLNNVDVGQDVRIEGGNFSDVIQIRQSQIGFSLDINSFGGHDVIDVDNLRLGRDIRIDTDSGSDSVSLNRISADDIYADLGSGNDDLEISFAVVDQVELFGSAGDDDILVRNTIATDIELDGNRGDDELSVRDSWIRNRLVLDGGQGSDTLTLDRTTARDADISGGSGWDFLILEGYDGAARAQIAWAASSVVLV